MVEAWETGHLVITALLLWTLTTALAVALTAVGLGMGAAAACRALCGSLAAVHAWHAWHSHPTPQRGAHGHTAPRHLETT